jgi:beta-glucosidase
VLPPDFRFGVATAGFQVEGGYNGPGEPANNWASWERVGRVEPSGIAVDFWHRYEELLDRAAAMGVDAFRLSVEWSRVEPEPGVIDETALAGYESILAACHARGMQPLVTLHHFTHPAWLGEDFWLTDDAPERFASWVELAVGRLAPLCRHWVTLNEVNVIGLCSYVLGMFPPGRRGAARDMFRALDTLVAAHVKGYEVIHRLQDDAVVTTNNASMSLYELDRVVVDVLLSRTAGLGRDEVGGWLEDSRRRWYERLPAPGRLERGLRRAAGSLGRRGPGTSGRSGGSEPSGGSVGSGLFPRAMSAVWDSPHECTLDVIGLDYYDPTIASHARVPGRHGAGGRLWSPAAELWEDRVVPARLADYCAANAAAGLGLWVVENGLCNRVHRGRSYPRPDGWDRPRYLAANLAALVAAIDAGVPVGAYYHWTLTDNYEWGSYEPRFGLLGIDRERGVRILGTDAMGSDAAGAYRRLVEGLRKGDRSVLAGVTGS